MGCTYFEKKICRNSNHSKLLKIFFFSYIVEKTKQTFSVFFTFTLVTPLTLLQKLNVTLVWTRTLPTYFVDKQTYLCSFITIKISVVVKVYYYCLMAIEISRHDSSARKRFYINKNQLRTFRFVVLLTVLMLVKPRFFCKQLLEKISQKLQQTPLKLTSFFPTNNMNTPLVYTLLKNYTHESE